jgi:hypothetical protein
MGMRVVIKHPVVSDPTKHLDPFAGELVAESDRVVASVEDEERDLGVLGQEHEESADLADRGCGRIAASNKTHRVERLGPRVVRPAELAHPLITPPRDDRLACTVS